MAAPMTTISELLTEQASTKREAPLFSWWEDEAGDVKVQTALSYGEVDKSVSGIARKVSVAPGERAMLVFEPGLLFIRAFFGCIRAGVVPVPVYPPNPRKRSTADAEAFVSIQAGCGAEVALTSASYSWAKKAADFAALDLRGKRWPKDLKWIVLDDDLTETPPPPAKDVVHEDGVAFLQYTSGSTSAPKGVVVTHGALMHNLNLIVEELAADETTVVVSWLPSFHDMGLIGSYIGVVKCGGRGFYASPISFVKRPNCWLEAVSKFRGTHMQAPNFAYALALRKRDSSKNLDLSCAKHFINGAEPIDPATLDSFDRVFSAEAGLPRGIVFPTYGLAEHVVLVSTNGKRRVTVDLEALRERKEVVEIEGPLLSTETQTYVGCGVPHQDVIVKIVAAGDDEDDSDIKLEDVTHTNRVGEIWLASKSVARGYWNLSTEAFGNDLGDGLKYLRTGDEGFLKDGEVFVCGRIKDMLIVNGKNYYPQDIEKVVEQRYPTEIRAGCTAAFEHGQGCAVVAEIRGDTDEAFADDVAKTVATEANIDVARIVLIKAKSIPKTTSGKIARRRTRTALETGAFAKKKVVLVDLILGSKSGITGTAAKPKKKKKDESNEMTDLERRLTADLAEIAHVDNIGLDVPLSAVLGSLETAQFAGLLEHKYKCPKLPEDLLYRHETTLRAVGHLVTTFGGDEKPFDDAVFQRTIAPLEIEQGGNNKPSTGEKPGFIVENCPCFVFCCPGLLKKKKKTKQKRK